MRGRVKGVHTNEEALYCPKCREGSEQPKKEGQYERVE